MRPILEPPLKVSLKQTITFESDHQNIFPQKLKVNVERFVEESKEDYLKKLETQSSEK